MNPKYVPIGEVKTQIGSVAVSVDPSTGFVLTSFLSSEGRLVHSSVLNASEVLELASLLARASSIAPSIKAAHEVRMRARATAEDTYDRIVNRAVGGAW